jgi:hypothetical protein
MTTELTHEEAAALRMTSFPSEDAYTLHLSGMIDCIDGQRCHYRLSDKGHEALADYDAKWVTVRKEDLQIVIEELDAKIAEHDELYAGFEDRLARMDDARRAMTRLLEALK